MKLFIVIAICSLLAVITVSSLMEKNLSISDTFQLHLQAEFQNAKTKLIHPDFLFTHSWEYQGKLTELQADIDESIKETQVAVSNVLKQSTNNTLKQYQTHINEVENIYIPMLDGFQTLQPGACRNDAEDVLNRTTTNTGYRASNCASTYDNRVQSAISTALNSLNRFGDFSGQVQSIVVKSFVGKNSFVNPEKIEDKIVEIYDFVKDRWNSSKPEIEAVRNSLSTFITAQFNELISCHGANLNYAKRFFEMFEETVQICIDFDKTPNPFAASKSRTSRSIIETPFSKKHAEFLAAFESQDPFEWKA